jgi:hypothetical protein
VENKGALNEPFSFHFFYPKPLMKHSLENKGPLIDYLQTFVTRFWLPNRNFRNCQICLNMAQCSRFHAGMCTFGSQILVPKVYIKCSGHTIGHCAVNTVITVQYPTLCSYSSKMTLASSQSEH